MKHYILSIAGAALMLAPAYAQSTTPVPPAPGSTQAENQHYKARQENQADRIRQGVRSGKLTPQQGRRLARQNRRINREAHAMSARNGGKLNAHQEARINRQMNRQSGRIFRGRH